MEHSEAPVSLQSPTGKAKKDFLLQLAIEMDCKELPAPPPPSPEYRTAQMCLPIDELLMLSRKDALGPKERSSSISEAGTNRNVSSPPPSISKNSPLRQVACQVDLDVCSKKTPSPGHNRRRGCSLILSSFSNRHAARSDVSGRDRSFSTSSLQGISKSTSRRTSPAFNMACLRSTIHAIPSTPRSSTSSSLRSPPQIYSRPPLRDRQISSPIISEQPSSPTLFNFPRPVTPSTMSQSRSDSGSTHSSDALRKEELVSYFSDSEDDSKNSKRSSLSKKGSLGKSDSRGRGKRFRGRLSGTFAFLSCGSE